MSTTWEEVRREAEEIIKQDDFTEDLVRRIILDHDDFASAISHLLAEQFSKILSADRWRALFATVFSPDIKYDDGYPTLEEMGLLDLRAVMERDPASEGMVNPFLFFKGFKAIQAHRIAHVLWKQGRTHSAHAVQARCSDLYAVDIHPTAKIGPGLMIDHGTGIVIGGTAVVGANCSFLHGVTLGATGKDVGDRHPKIGHDVLIGCGASILGNIKIGNCCKIGAGSIVLKPLPCGATAVGNPAKIVGKSMCPSAAAGMDVALQYVLTSQRQKYNESWSIWGEGEEAVYDESSDSSNGSNSTEAT